MIARDRSRRLSQKEGVGHSFFLVQLDCTMWHSAYHAGLPNQDIDESSRHGRILYLIASLYSFPFFFTLH